MCTYSVHEQGGSPSWNEREAHDCNEVSDVPSTGLQALIEEVSGLRVIYTCTPLLIRVCSVIHQDHVCESAHVDAANVVCTTI